MILNTKEQRVSVQRNQDSEPFAATVVGEVYEDIRTEKGEFERGAHLGYLVQDERGFVMGAQAHQMKVA